MGRFTNIHEEAQGRWRGILCHLGISSIQLTNKHGPCPMCGGTKPFRFDDKDGRGTWICTHCGAGNGLDLAMAFKGWDFKEAVNAIRPLVGMTSLEEQPKGQTEEQQRKMRQDLWAASRQVVTGDPADFYLRERGVSRPAYAPSLRFCPSAFYAQGVEFPAMVAAVQGPDGQGVSLHRTFIKDGQKAPVDSAKKLIPGTIPDGSAIRLSPVCSTMGVAEGIETALAAWEIFGVPTWATVSSTMMAKWQPPEGVTEVFVFGDNDPGFAGQHAAYGLARSLVRLKIKTRVLIPDEVGTDFADHLDKTADHFLKDTQ